MPCRPASGLSDHRRLGDLALAGVLFFVLACIAAQLLRPDLDWLRAPLSFYLLGDYGWMLRTGYFALGTALMLLGLGYYRTLAHSARSGATLMLFCLAGVSLDVTAMAGSDTVAGRLSVEEAVHGIAASLAFLCVTTAMMLQAWRLRADARWQRRFATAFSLALLCFVAMWTHALWRDAPRGLSQKIVVALILLWLAMAAWWLRRATTLPELAEPQPEDRP